MLCRNPYMSSTGLAYGCGQCLPCLYNKRRVWTHRIMLEAMQYEHNAFVTLTYSDENLPERHSVVPDHTRLFLNRLRGRVAPERFRFFLVGEYGDKSERPHYHAAIFNFKSCEYGQSRYSRVKTRCCDRCELVRETWGLGNVFLGTLEDDSAGYMAGYVTKRMTRGDDVRLKGRHPEFTRQSNRPGLGKDAMWEVASVLMRYELAVAGADVPVALRHGKKELPLGRYLRRHLRKMMGKDEKASAETMAGLQAEMLVLREEWEKSPEFAKGATFAPFKDHLIALTAGRVAGMEARAKIYGKRERL